MTDSQRTESPAFIEHRVPRDRGSLYVRDFPGSGAAFVLLHGFPDNSHIYDDLIPHLTSAGRRTISIDFLGFGASDKPEGAHYSFEQQLQDLEAVVGAAREDHPGRPRCRWPGRRQLRSEAPGTRGRRLLDERVLRRRPWTASSRAYRALREQTPQISRPAFLGEPGAVRVAVGLSARPNAGRPDRDTESPLQPVPWSDNRQQLQATAKRGTCLRPNDLSILG